jgi:hypothetical protein
MGRHDAPWSASTEFGGSPDRREVTDRVPLAYRVRSLADLPAPLGRWRQAVLAPERPAERGVGLPGGCVDRGGWRRAALNTDSCNGRGCQFQRVKAGTRCRLRPEAARHSSKARWTPDAGVPQLSWGSSFCHRGGRLVRSRRQGRPSLLARNPPQATAGGRPAF